MHGLNLVNMMVHWANIQHWTYLVILIGVFMSVHISVVTSVFKCVPLCLLWLCFSCCSFCSLANDVFPTFKHTHTHSFFQTHIRRITPVAHFLSSYFFSNVFYWRSSFRNTELVIPFGSTSFSQPHQLVLCPAVFSVLNPFFSISKFQIGLLATWT